MSSTKLLIEFQNFSRIFSGEEILEIDSNVNQNRANLPSLIIVTPFDKSGIVWTTDQPSLMILKRLTLLADAALRLIDSCLLIHESRSSLQVTVELQLRF